MIFDVGKPDLTKSSAFSLVSIATAITEKINTINKVVEMKFFNMYQSIFFIILKKRNMYGGANVAEKEQFAGV
jgi:hypothetical protein